MGRGNKKSEDKIIVNGIMNGDEDAFRKMFEIYYPGLCLFATKYVKNTGYARDIVQEVYLKIWDNHSDFEINSSLKAYLYQAVRNQSLNYLKKHKRTQNLEEQYANQFSVQTDFQTAGRSDELPVEKLSKKIWECVDLLPERRKTVFILSRKHGLTYPEIAEVMGITRKTVENQMGMALQFLKEKLDF
ncbi:MAG: RNA polymerase sigma-70 factor [Balneolaceae bacterium]